MQRKEFFYKIKDKLRGRFILKNWNQGEYEKYCAKYKTYRYSKKYSKNLLEDGLQNVYMTARPNPKAGIGHQMANWIAGYWFAKFFGLKFAHIPFSNVSDPFVADKWDQFLNYGSDEVQVKDLLKKGWKMRYLPLFNEFDENHLTVIRKIINSYQGHKVILCLEQDQFFRDQHKVRFDLEKKFKRKSQKSDLLFKKDEFNIAVHIRRGDIVQAEGKSENANLSMRWIANEYFVNAIDTALQTVKTDKKIHLYIFSQGKMCDYPELQKFDNVTFCLDMAAMPSFEHMIYADALITSKSSFSYKPALMNCGYKFCPKVFWHGYPQDAEDWILLDQYGHIDHEEV